MKKFFVLSLVLAFGLVLTGASCTQTTDTTTSPAAATTISVSPLTIAPGEYLDVTYDIVEPLGDFAWLGIIPSDTIHNDEVEADAVDVNFHFLSDASGTYTFTAPIVPGQYDVRIYSDDGDDALELGYATFTIE